MATPRTGTPKPTLDLAKIISASVTARLGKRLAPGGGILAGILVKPGDLERSGVSATSLAKSIARDVAEVTGLKIVPKTIKVPGGILAGFIPPKVFDR
jgi:hypothetical protein